jgi:hypothetical protein
VEEIRQRISRAGLAAAARATEGSESSSVSNGAKFSDKHRAEQVKEAGWNRLCEVSKASEHGYHHSPKQPRGDSDSELMKKHVLEYFGCIKQRINANKLSA